MFSVFLFMDDKEYSSLLDEARKKLPEKVFEKSRFEVPKVQSIVEGKKTIIINFGKISEHLRREKAHLGKFLAKELGTSETLEEGKLILVGKFYPNVLNDKISKYVHEFVTCKECGKPDSVLSKDDRVWFLKCEACGAKRPIPSVLK